MKKADRTKKTRFVQSVVLREIFTDTMDHLKDKWMLDKIKSELPLEGKRETKTVAIITSSS